MDKANVKGMPKTLVVVADGRSEDAAGEPSLQNLLKQLPKAHSGDKPIKVIYVTLGPDADIAALRQIAKATGQTAVQVKSMADLQRQRQHALGQRVRHRTV